MLKGFFFFFLILSFDLYLVNLGFTSNEFKDARLADCSKSKPHSFNAITNFLNLHNIQNMIYRDRYGYRFFFFFY